MSSPKNKESREYIVISTWYGPVLYTRSAVFGPGPSIDRVWSVWRKANWAELATVNAHLQSINNQ